MKKIKFVLISVMLFFAALFLLNIKVTTLQGIDYRVQTIKIPLYLKVLDFYDRHFNYKVLVKRILPVPLSPKEDVLRMCSWVYENIRPQPEELRVVDDHVWHIIVRGYGASDQFQDVFTTLCNYAGYQAFWEFIWFDQDKKPLSFVKLGDNWHVFDAYNGCYFLDKNGNFADVGLLVKGDWRIESISGSSKREKIDYQQYFSTLGSLNWSNWKFSRAAIQSPLKRFIYGGIKDLFKSGKSCSGDKK